MARGFLNKIMLKQASKGQQVGLLVRVARGSFEQGSQQQIEAREARRSFEHSPARSSVTPRIPLGSFCFV